MKRAPATKRPADYDVSGTVSAVVRVHPDVFKAVLTDEWRLRFYSFHTERDVVEHLAYNLMHNRFRLSELDGFADMPDSHAILVNGFIDFFDWEIAEKPATARRPGPKTA